MQRWSLQVCLQSGSQRLGKGCLAVAPGQPFHWTVMKSEVQFLEGNFWLLRAWPWAHRSQSIRARPPWGHLEALKVLSGSHVSSRTVSS